MFRPRMFKVIASLILLSLFVTAQASAAPILSAPPSDPPVYVTITCATTSDSLDCEQINPYTVKYTRSWGTWSGESRMYFNFPNLQPGESTTLHALFHVGPTMYEGAYTSALGYFPTFPWGANAWSPGVRFTYW